MDRINGELEQAVKLVPEMAFAYKATLRSQKKKSTVYRQRKVPTRLQILKEALSKDSHVRRLSTDTMWMGIMLEIKDWDWRAVRGT